MTRKEEGSITIYFCLSIVIIGSLLLSLLEVARIEGLSSDAQEWTDFVLMSLCGGYEKELFDTYEIFALDGSFGSESLALEYGEAEMSVLLQENINFGTQLNLYRLQPQVVEITEYRLLTDNKGQVFLKYAANMMKKKLSQKAVKKAVKSLSNKADNINPAMNLEADMDTASRAIESAEAEKIKQIEEQNTQTTNTASTNDSVNTPAVSNPIEEMKQLLDQGIWSLAVPANAQISNKAITLDETLENRKLESGNMKEALASSSYDRILFQEYVKEAGGSFFSPASENALSYGMEYVLCGKCSDEENLKAVVNRLLLIREGINYVYLQTDTVKQAEALSVATALAGSVPAVIPIVQQGILAAWAYAESVCEVRALLSGKKIPLVKSASNFKVSLSSIATDAMGDYTETAGGMDYEGYVNLLLYTKNDKTVAYRMLDLMEKSLFIKADKLVMELVVYAKYGGNDVFSGIFTEDISGMYVFENTASHAYQ